ncbi:hypothetical protein C7H19_17970 [Aphanothece hegewaldii CCALA 016]|uniref:Uncharacterized protein n=1 Tax=Aphanothece hegewaldii CCALA 016 TaxID=2107694 RepID=A0A2T1LUE2_9CHRO|nr:hypothetical protein C7H19_17970 [Aphanothece hegewaldii CCALA 016]
MALLLNLFILLLIFISLILIIQFIQEINKQKRKSIKTYPPKFNRSNINRSKVNQLRNQLLKMVGGNQQTMKRLIKHLRSKHPGEQETWYFEKAIYDLERDRKYH